MQDGDFEVFVFLGKEGRGVVEAFLKLCVSVFARFRCLFPRLGKGKCDGIALLD